MDDAGVPLMIRSRERKDGVKLDKEICSLSVEDENGDPGLGDQDAIFDSLAMLALPDASDQFAIAPCVSSSSSGHAPRARFIPTPESETVPPAGSPAGKRVKALPGPGIESSEKKAKEWVSSSGQDEDSETAPGRSEGHE